MISLCTVAPHIRFNTKSKVLRGAVPLADWNYIKLLHTSISHFNIIQLCRSVIYNKICLKWLTSNSKFSSSWFTWCSLELCSSSSDSVELKRSRLHDLLYAWSISAQHAMNIYLWELLLFFSSCRFKNNNFVVHHNIELVS